MFHVPTSLLDAILAEDAPCGDLTTRALGFGGQGARISFTARMPQVVACSEVAAALFRHVGGHVCFSAPSGQWMPAGEQILQVEGSADALFLAWKQAQTLMEWAGGLASDTHDIVQAARAVRPDVVVACTRKAPPGMRGLAIRSIMAGGAVVHRAGLSETVLVFPEHRAFLPEDGREAVKHLKQSLPERKIVVEVTSVEEAMVFLETGADILQLEKFSLQDVKKLRTFLNGLAPNQPVPLLAAAGAVGPDNAADYVRAGASILVTSHPYFAKPRDIQVLIRPLSSKCDH
ncbi:MULTISPECIES: ModD protein [Acetobacter]|uniref:Putative pyrophosphorylase ModD n=1 Tax=Acetobacter lovaniensis TaxID=104100 RepID=A0A841QCV8_9PROT|nr:ModD protein [Acetobacter lovaniensis]MBB6456679.1 molybdenum transport protein [Acetobacter lovaniensis]MCP1239265.1 ModD protein [Acetobacter lovaniensis]NHN81502.1 ModD protein [Acetobacter lovaniensis]GBQ65483.1 nicotinate-nucleotide pyrophosphorylase [Acetobacter lovaniensis NRIC 0474]